MANGNYLADFADIANWANDFTAGIGTTNFASYPITAGGTANDGIRTTKSSATFVTSTSGGIQKGTGSLLFLSTGSGTTQEAVAVDLLFDFTGRTAGTLSYDWVAVDNSSGTRPTSMRVFWSIDGTTFTEITAAQVLDVQSVSSGSVTAVALPAAFSGSATARLRFYNHAGAITGSGNRDKFQLDNVAVTSTPGGGPIAPTITLNPTPANATNWPGTSITFKVAAVGTAPLFYRWQNNGVDLADGGQIAGSGTTNLTLSALDPSLAGAYRAIISNAVGFATSSVANLVIISNAPAIDSNPLSRTGIAGKTATFQVLASVPGNITGAPATQYRWQGNGVDIVDGGRFSGAGTPKLTITGIIAGTDELSYTCIASNSVGAATSSGASLTVATTGTLAFWNFNIATNPATPEVYYGVASASLAGITNGFFSTADDGNDPGDPTKYWGTSQYPSNPVNPATNKTTGVRFDVDTTGLRNIMFTLSTRLTTTASKYSRLQYTTDGTTFIDYPGSSTYTGGGSTWDSTGSGPANAGRIFDLSGFAGVRNNPNFGVRVVTETENTATYGTSSTTNYVGLSAGYSTTGTVSYDLVDFEASTIIGNAAPTIGYRFVLHSGHGLADEHHLVHC